nr:putative receptor-like protein kinase At4g00960 [Ipomoea batatas]
MATISLTSSSPPSPPTMTPVSSPPAPPTISSRELLVRYYSYPPFSSPAASPAFSADYSSPPPPPTIPRSPPGNHGSSSPKLIIAIVVPVIGIILLFIAVLYFLMRIRNSKKQNTELQTTEYAMHGEFSVKSDVFSFGVMVIEIITGKKNRNTCQTTNRAQDLLSYAWEQWRDGTPLEILDPVLANSSYTVNEVIHCLHIGLLCVQEDADERPTMEDVVLMLSSYSTNNWSAPREPAFYRNRSGNVPKEISLELSVTVSEASTIGKLCPR